ncbi:hypothetical protein COEREDRAFT_96592 [Coemansia reversa NRRL 1564]|uniref:Mannosyltransferase n=1 Tax=Coemansia reversa (strain ATCC 12441 / NRRL 1564) TaxID=763665 RepID=A0A2G5BF87_COERN|nr:hypothetical protein COEREDRAFT_96592 [Coemansia reversa NRRL 1564]|eukprot:PIA17675.1 hypothetical protein COEREDRAFT_96592 [Coemansia reversa NRRL 1564]
MFMIKVLQQIFGKLELSPWIFLYTCRIFSAMLSFVVDICVYKTVRRLHPGAAMRPTMILLASSYSLVVFHTHTFANSFASVLLAVCLNMLSVIESRVQSSVSRKAAGNHLLKWPCVGLGSALALGTFVHISFPMFSLPLGIVCVVLLYRMRQRAQTIQSSTMVSIATAANSGVFWFAFSGLATALIIVIVDSLYYRSLHLSFTNGRLHLSGTMTFAPLNNILYNTDRTNLAVHGIHPWYNHILLSMPVLFGPLYFLAIAKAGMFISLSNSRTNASYTSVTAAISIITGLAMLSMAPHQEPRFLLPVLPAIMVCTWRWHSIFLRRLWHFWVLFNLILAIAYGVIHQAGVIPTLDFLKRTSVLPTVHCTNASLTLDVTCMDTNVALENSLYDTNVAHIRTTVFFFSTFMPPRHMLSQPVDRDALQARVELHDLISMEDYQVRNQIRNSVLVNCTLAQQTDPDALLLKKLTSGTYESCRTLFVMPASIDWQRVVSLDTIDYSLMPIFSNGPHVNFDHIADVIRHPLQRARLNVYLLCTN